MLLFTLVLACSDHALEALDPTDIGHDPDGNASGGPDTGASKDSGADPDTADTAMVDTAGDDTAAPDTAAPDTGEDSGGGEPDERPAMGLLYLHSSSRLYTYDVASRTLTEVGSLDTVWLDLAIAPDGTAYATYDQYLTTVDLTTGLRIRLLGQLERQSNAISVGADGTVVAAAGSRLGRLDLGTLLVAKDHTDLRSSAGDTVVLADGTWVWAVGDLGLVHFDPSTGTAAELGVHAQHYMGLACAGAWLYGVGSSGDIHQIDPATGAVTTYDSLGLTFYGAASDPLGCE